MKTGMPDQAGYDEIIQTGHDGTCCEQTKVLEGQRSSAERATDGSRFYVMCELPCQADEDAEREVLAV